ncbi:hypothetical protein SPBR_03006 [Sporothrix brasiliensis 5110]|uniref:Branched-chain-amino-acid aminotransferase-like protein 2 n=1 Tax=Sporothrix brasiliensis 5110 TaxID=1398154 RepID=A0A0C2ISZ8_9PEZI|nr:uncharacterized protein SPBR_03006 [Sporothrix brasiliensis 5110]KIH92151.1 hypothetical protein SPBR_03006 [Sporothrix brasiliensis 5110]
MAGRPIFVATHPRSCSTAFERVFMTRPDDISCAHEPFGDAFYFGPERLSARFADEPKLREESGFTKTTYKDVLDSLLKQDKRLFIKDMAYYLFAPKGHPTSVAPSLADQANGVDKQTSDRAANPTTIPLSALQKFRFAFLIRNPRRSIPSYYRCTVPPLVETTKFNEFMPCEAGYKELRHLFDYLRAQGLVSDDDITIIDADDLLDRPAEGIEAFCKAVDLDFRPEMLQWDDSAHQDHATAAFEKWAGWHNDALASTGLKARTSHKKTPSADEEDAEWASKYGAKGQKIIRDCVDTNMPDYEYLKQFTLKF